MIIKSTNSHLPLYPKLLATFISALVVVLVIINVLVSAQVSYWGYQLGQLELKASYLEEANRLLSQDISAHTSLTKFHAHAEALGYNAAVAYHYLSEAAPVAMNPVYQP